MAQGSYPNRVKGFFSSTKCRDQLWGQLSPLFNGYWGCFPGVKWPGHEVDHWPPPSAKVKKEQSYTSAPPLYHHGMDWENFTLNKLASPKNSLKNWQYYSKSFLCVITLYWYYTIRDRIKYSHCLTLAPFHLQDCFHLTDSLQSQLSLSHTSRLLEGLLLDSKNFEIQSAFPRKAIQCLFFPKN